MENQMTLIIVEKTILEENSARIAYNIFIVMGKQIFIIPLGSLNSSS